MGAMALPLHWIPEDDVLLRLAVEAGASLESLAKGAVQFSRRFTVQELKNRWLSLLYDPVYKEASEHMTEVERLGVTKKLDGVKNIACGSRKRKRENIRQSYYAMLKSKSNEPLDMMCIGLVSGPGHSNFIDSNELLPADCGNVNHASDNLGVQGPDYDIRHHSFPEYGPPEGESSGNGFPNHGHIAFSTTNVQDNPPYRYDENISLTGDCGEIPEFVHSKELPPSNLFHDDDLLNQGGTCSEFDGQSFRSFECPMPEMPVWRSSQEIAEADVPIQLGDGDLQKRDEFVIPLVANESDALGYGSAPSNTKSCDSILDLWFELSDDEDGLLYMDTDQKEAIQNSYLKSFESILESPNQCESSSSGLGKIAVAEDELLIDGTNTQNNKGLFDHQEVAVSELTSSGSTMKVGPEYRNGLICCRLNTEEPEIPNNDDVFLLQFPSPTKSSGAHWGLHDNSYLGSSSVKNFSTHCNANGGSLMMKRNQKNSSVPSGKMEQFHPSDASLRYQHGIKFELPESSVQAATLREARSSDCVNHVGLANVTANNFISESVTASRMEMGQGKNIGYTSLGPCPVKHETRLIIHQNLPKKSIGCQSQEDNISEISNYRSSNAVLCSRQTDVPQAIDQSLLSDQEELWSDDESGVPCFSDVEAMILDMDLNPDEFDFNNNPEVRRYQHEETKRTIIRLEQGADAFTQRALAAHGAFAHLYGRFSKYFIKKPEVLLGRASEDIKVDIDLGREKYGNKISRRQAMIKLDMHGVFHLKNLGKGPIYVNGEEVNRGQSLGLVSGCIIEVRGVDFLFETNHKMIKQFVDSSAGGELSVDQKLSD